MKKTLLVLALVAATCSAHAQHRYSPPRHFDRHQGSGSRGEWLIPAIIGGVLVYSATRPAEAAPPPPVVYVQPQPQVIQPRISDENCPNWQRPVYSRVRVQDNWGNIREEYQFAGCVQ